MAETQYNEVTIVRDMFGGISSSSSAICGLWLGHKNKNNNNNNNNNRWHFQRHDMDDS